MTISSLRTQLLAACATVLPGAALAAPALNSFVPMGAGTEVHGPAQAGQVVHFQVALRMHDADGLQKLVDHNKVLTPAQLDAYLPSRAHQQAVAEFLRAQGVQVDAMPASRLAIRASASAATVSRLLGVGFVRVTSEGRDYVSADREPVIPATIAPLVTGIIGLQPQLHAMKGAVPASAGTPVRRNTITGGVTPYYPIDLQTAYKSLGNGDGAGTTTAIVIDTFPYASDLVSFWATTGVNQSIDNISFIQTVPGTLPPPSAEESIDAEQSSSIAPASKVRVYASTDLSFANIDTTYQAIVDDLMAGVRITQVSISLGACEINVAGSQKAIDNDYFRAITALGASIFVSSGDSGARTCGEGIFGGKVPSFFATSPNVTAVGGTTLNLAPDSSIGSETSWGGSGGGTSKYFATPSWQQSLGYAKRAVPDVASDANPQTGVYTLYGGGIEAQYGGTSISAPAWAGFMALVNAKRIAQGKPTLGLVAARTTALVGTSNFRDITRGKNGYNAGVGYDLVTGVGSPVMKYLAPTLIAQP